MRGVRGLPGAAEGDKIIRGRVLTTSLDTSAPRSLARVASGDCGRPAPSRPVPYRTPSPAASSKRATADDRSAETTRKLGCLSGLCLSGRYWTLCTLKGLRRQRPLAVLPRKEYLSFLVPRRRSMAVASTLGYTYQLANVLKATQSWFGKGYSTRSRRRASSISGL
uniref:Uncharacterized protein n=1 Tax=Steinernema glaseri TaxID=37863 RepID=A0A1I8AJQ6_9BILA